MTDLTNFLIIFLLGFLCVVVFSGAVDIIRQTFKINSNKNNHKNQGHDNFDKRKGYL